MGFIHFCDMNFLRDEENHLFFIDEQAAVQGVDLGSCFETAKTKTIYEKTEEEVAARGTTCVCQMASATAQSAARM